MNIINANNEKFKPDLLALLEQMPNKAEEFTPAKYSGWLDKNIGKDSFGFWLAYHQDKPVGLITCEIVDIKKVKNLYVSFWFVESDDKKIAGELLECAEKWGNSKGVHRLIGETIRLSGIRTFINKYGLTLEKILFSKEI